jgi:erythromycin esterase
MARLVNRRHPDPPESKTFVDAVRALRRPLRDAADLDPLMARIGDARLVLIGEASHGTAEYYEWRALLTRRLLEERDFSFVAVEGDWPDCYRIDRYVKGLTGPAGGARDVLHAFERWPTWMWANHEVAAFANWLRERNDARPTDRRAGFYGLDVYSLWESLHRVIAHLEKSEPSAVAAARRVYRCFERYDEDAQAYAAATRWLEASCEDAVVAMLAEIRKRDAEVVDRDPEAQLDAAQNAAVVRNAELYYRTMVRGGPESWNVRDEHMTATLERLLQHHGDGAKAVVWEHNTHVGDARATDMAAAGLVNVGQLVRERHAPMGVVLVGFGSYAGSVIAGREWDAPIESMPVPAARDLSWEHVLHQIDPADALLIFGSADAPELFEPRGHRAIGVVYRPEHDPYGNYVPTILPKRYDAFLSIDRSTALHPLREVRARAEGEVPETYPSGV